MKNVSFSENSLYALNDPCYNIVNCTPLGPIRQDNNIFSQFQETGRLILYLDNPLLCMFADLHMSDIKLAILSQLTSNTTTSLIYKTPAKLAEDGITTKTLSANSTRKFSFYCNVSNIFTTNLYFCLFNTLITNPTKSSNTRKELFECV